MRSVSHIQNQLRCSDPKLKSVPARWHPVSQVGSHVESPATQTSRVHTGHASSVNCSSPGACRSIALHRHANLPANTRPQRPQASFALPPPVQQCSLSEAPRMPAACSSSSSQAEFTAAAPRPEPGASLGPRGPHRWHGGPWPMTWPVSDNNYRHGRTPLKLAGHPGDVLAGGKRYEQGLWVSATALAGLPPPVTLEGCHCMHVCRRLADLRGTPPSSTRKRSTECTLERAGLPPG